LVAILHEIDSIAAAMRGDRCTQDKEINLQLCVDEVVSIGDASARDGNERRKALLCEIQLLNQFSASSWKDRNIDRTFHKEPN
jgi:hypothetical protein